MSIITLTLNPCIDRTYWVDEHGETPISTELQTGGKGINVARVLGNLGQHAIAVCPLGGETGELFRSLAAAEGITLADVETASPTRIIDTYVRRRDYDQRVEYVRGGAYTQAELDALDAKLFELLPGADMLAICGSASCEDAARRVPGIISRAREMGVTVLLDSNGTALTYGVTANPDMIKPNEDELFALTGIKDDPAAAAQKLMEQGVGNVLASLGKAGCMWAAQSSVDYCPAPQVDTVNPIGSGDSFVAGFIYAALRGCPPQLALMIANACGAANAAMFPAARITRADVEKLTGWPLL
ncbi:MAG: hypothetical protein IJC56_04225 [Clostridia bacterium]|nr:hypothetical protein [Clostridia bacterium]